MNQKKVALIGVPMDLGADRRGVDMGPSAMRYAGVMARLTRLGFHVDDVGDLVVPRPSGVAGQDLNLKHLPEVVEVNRNLAATVSEKVREGYIPLVLGGDHSIAIGTIAGVAQHYRNLGVLWFDAHGDLNTAETSPSGNIHGMPLAVSLGFGHDDLVRIGGFAPKVRPENVVIIGARDLDPGERELIKRIGLRVFTMHEIDRLGMSRVMEEALAIVTNGTDGVHLSLDLDAVDPHDAPGVGTPVVGGLTYRESHLAMEMLAEAGVLVSAEVVEVNPILDVENRTAKVAVALIGSAFGEKLL
ncbi:arginase [Calditerricola satsumensis]|uniref:Arginase n=1 Tax=Calditerricola satsumensis TaxID=373054 RepID=A0A8J3BB41_9BACI|nr:arginase [Calditerricola satsumensis]GGJ98089.1 arginase [Calditerricola satsumensis]